MNLYMVVSVSKEGKVSAWGTSAVWVSLDASLGKGSPMPAVAAMPMEEAGKVRSASMRYSQEARSYAILPVKEIAAAAA